VCVACESDALVGQKLRQTSRAADVGDGALIDYSRNEQSWNDRFWREAAVEMLEI